VLPLHLDDYKIELKVVKSEKLTYWVVCKLDTLEGKQNCSWEELSMLSAGIINQPFNSSDDCFQT